MFIKKKCAVLLAAYNGEDYIRVQLDSILGQDIEDFDIYISLDLSTDESYSICEEYSKKYDNIHLLSYEDKYGSASANFFRLIRDVDLSNYEFIALSDQDDFWFPWKLRKAINVLSDGNVAGYSSNDVAYWENQNTVAVIKSQPQTDYDYYFESAGHGCTYAFKSDALQDFKEKLIEKWELAKEIRQHDWLIYCFFRDKNLKWYIDSDFTMLYRQHSNNDFGVNQGLKSYINRFKKVRSGWYTKQIELNIDFLDSNFKMIHSKSQLVFNFFKLRRRLRDKFAILVFILIGGV